MKRRQSKGRVLIGPCEIAGVVSGLQQGLGRLGWDAEVILRWQHPFGYPFRASPSRLIRIISWLVLLEHGAHTRVPRLRATLSLITRWLSLPLLAARYDAVVYVGADTYLRGGLDRALLKRLGVRVVTIFCGSDARPPFLSGHWVAPDQGDVDFAALLDATADIRRRVAAAERDSHLVVNHPATAQFHKRPYLDWTVMGMPSPATPVGELSVTASSGSPVRVLHAPSDPKRKGSDLIREAVATLSGEGLAIEYVEVTGQPHANVQRLIASSDIVVDELYSDALLAGLALEAARAGKPVLVFGYAGALITSLAQRVGCPDLHYSAPDELLSRLRDLVVSPAQRDALGRQLHRFATTYWAPDEIARRYERAILGEPEAAWFDDPSAATYVHGWGVTEQRLAEVLCELLRRHGREVLGLPWQYDEPLSRLSAVRGIPASAND